MAAGEGDIAYDNPDDDFDERDGNARADGDQARHKSEAHPNRGYVPDIVENHKADTGLLIAGKAAGWFTELDDWSAAVLGWLRRGTGERGPFRA